MAIKETVRANIPDIFWIRSFLSKLKIRQYYRYVMPEKKILSAESSAEKRKEITNEFASKWPEYSEKAKAMIDDIVKKIPAYHGRMDLDTIKTDMLFCRLAYGFLPEEYVSFDLENKSMAERREFVSDIERYRYVVRMNDIVDFVLFMDKAKTYKKYKNYYKRDAISIENDRDWNKFNEFIKKHPMFVKKQVDLSKGDSVELVDLSDANARQAFNEMIKSGKHILEEKIVQSEIMSKLNASSVNTVRCYTLNTNDGVVIAYCFLRVGRGNSFVDNGGAGGLLVGIDAESGVCVTDAFDEFGKKFSVHPDTGVVFNGYCLPSWENMITTCKEMSSLMPNVGFIGWDMAYTDNGWVAVEGNGGGQMIGPQIVFERGIKREIENYIKNMRLYA